MTPRAEDRESVLREALAEVLHHVMCDVSHHDRPPARCHNWPKYPNIAASAAPRLLKALATPDRSRVEGLDRERLLRFVAAQPIGFGDWACVDCRPESDVLVEGFHCMVHEARAVLSDTAETGGEASDAKLG